MTFAFTPAVLRWMRRHADKLNEADMAQELGCAASTVRSICIAHGVALCRESDKHADLAPAPGAAPPLAPTLPKAPPKVHPRLDPALRGNHLAGFMELRLGKAAITAIDRKAAALRTTPAVLCAVLLEIIAAENMFDSILDLD